MPLPFRKATCWRLGRRLLAADFSGVSALLPAVRVERVQSLSHADFRRLLPRVLLDAQLEWAPHRCTVRFDDGRLLEIGFAAETERRLGSLRIVSTPLQFEFLGWPPATVVSFMTHLDRALQQGGG